YKEGFFCFISPSYLRERVMTRKSAVKQKNSDTKLILYVVPKAPKEAISSTLAPSSSSTSTSIPTNLDLEIIQEVFGSLPEKIMESKLLNPDEYLEDDDIEEYLKDFTIVTKAAPFTVTSNIKFTPKEKNNTDIQFNERTIYVTDIPLQMKPANIKQVFAKYGTVTDFKMTVR
ncbi:7832_t:CDS:2, partial [Funneliformis geosporum]